MYEEEFIDNFEEISKAYVATALAVTGVVTLTPQAKQPFEIKARKVEVEAASTPDYPLQPKRHTMEFLREIAHLRPRSNTFSAVFRVRSLVAYAIHRFFQERDFVYVHTPIITGSDAEGAGEMFRVTTRLQRRLFRQGDQPDGQRTAGGRDFRHGFPQHIYVRTDFPRRKFQHRQTRFRVLDDRARDCFR